MTLKDRINNYRDNLTTGVLARSSPEDADFIRGFDNAISNVVYALGKILEQEDEKIVLGTEEDFRNAPVGTVVTDNADGLLEWISIKDSEDAWLRTDGEIETTRDVEMALVCDQTVIRWGRGNE